MEIKGYKVCSKPTKYKYDIVRTRFRLDDSYIKLILTESRKADIKSATLQSQIEKRIEKISRDYDSKVNKILDNVILNNDLENYPIENLNRLVVSIMRVTKSLSSSLTSIVIGLEDMK